MADLWPFATHGVATEVLEWRTDVLRSQSSEQRLSLRSAPREVLTLRHRLDGAGLAQALALARRGMAQDWIVPLWMMAEQQGAGLSAMDLSVLVSASYADYRAPGYAVAASNGGTAHLMEVAAVRADGIDLAAPADIDLARPVISPARRARLLAPLEIERRNAALGFATARFLLQDSADLSGLRGVALYIAIDASNSMSGDKISAAMAAVQALVEELGSTAPPVLHNDICVVLWNAAVSGMQVFREADGSDFTALSAWLAAPVALGGATDFEVALSEAPAFFAGAEAKRRIVLFLTDGEPYPASSAAAAVTLLEGIADVEAFGFNIGLSNTSYTAMLDNTGADNVPVIAPGDTDTLRDTLLSALFGIPRYHGRDVLMDPGLLRQPLRETLSQAFEAVESGFGPMVLEPLRDLVERGSVLGLKDIGPARTWARRRWLHRLRGRARSFWLPTWGRELNLQALGVAGDDFLIVAPDLDLADWTRRHVLLDLPGAPLFREIISASFDALGHRLEIAPLDRDVPISTKGHFITMVRLDTDRIELEHRMTGTELNLTTLEVPDEV
jgi:uncharacterized protein YegL